MAILLSLFFTVVLLEICLRIVGPPYYRFNNLSEEYYSNPRGYHDVLRKEGRHTVYGLSYHEDSHGYRIQPGNDQSSIDVPEIQILGLGDSFFYGRGVRHEDICLTRLENLLSHGSDRVAVKNCGVVGAGVQDVVEIYSRESASLSPGSLVLYGLVLNDFGLDMAEPIRGLNFIDINNGGYTFNPLRERSALINFIIHMVEKRQLHKNTLRAYLESFEGESAELGFELLDNLNQLVIEDEGTLVVIIFPLLYDFENYRFGSIHRKIVSFCTSHRILYLDLFPAFSRHTAEDLWANPTDHHPNEVAHRIAAEEIAAFIDREVPGFSDRQMATPAE
jgi:hypothetical protein